VLFVVVFAPQTVWNAQCAGVRPEQAMGFGAAGITLTAVLYLPRGGSVAVTNIPELCFYRFGYSGKLLLPRYF
jgi:hypothetical protein